METMRLCCPDINDTNFIANFERISEVLKKNAGRSGASPASFPVAQYLGRATGSHHHQETGGGDCGGASGSVSLVHFSANLKITFVECS